MSRLKKDFRSTDAKLGRVCVREYRSLEKRKVLDADLLIEVLSADASAIAVRSAIERSIALNSNKLADSTLTVAPTLIRNQ